MNIPYKYTWIQFRVGRMLGRRRDNQPKSDHPMAKPPIKIALLVFRGLAIIACLSSAPTYAATDAAAVAAATPSAKRFLEEFGNATSLGKACGYREEAIGQYYSKEFARLIRLEAKGPTADQDVDREVGIALVSAKIYANQRTAGRRFTSEQCAMARQAIDESVPRGYDKP